VATKTTCPKCGYFREMTRHHIYPRRHFKSDQVILLCRDCHDGIEKIIYNREKQNGGRKLDSRVYWNIAVSYLGSTTNVRVMRTQPVGKMLGKRR